MYDFISIEFIRQNLKNTFMIKNILDLLMVNNHYGKHESIEIAKGKNEIPTDWKKAYNQIKRIWRRK
jgi:hypothetical protein